MKTVLLLLIIAALLGGVGYGYYHWKIAQNEHELTLYPDVPYDNQLGRTLVIYYSLDGHTQAVAETVAALTNGRTHRIETVHPIKESRWFRWKVLKQLIFNQLPAVRIGALHLNEYDTVFVGGPVWWLAPATPLLSFLHRTDFEAKRVVPFATQGGTSGWFFDRFKKEVYNADLQQGAAFNAVGPKYEPLTKFKIIDWLNKLPAVSSKKD